MAQQLDRRRLMGMLALGLAGMQASCSAARATSGAQDRVAAVGPAPALASVAARVSPLPSVPPSRPGQSQVVHHGPTAGRRIALTVDDGASGEVVAGNVAFAQRVGVHLTFTPNGAYNRSGHRTPVRCVR